MYAHQHAAVSVGATFTVAWAAGVAPPWSVVGWTVLGGTLIDVIDHPLYQLTYGRRQGVLACRGRMPWRPGGRVSAALARNWYLVWGLIIAAVGVVGLDARPVPHSPSPFSRGCLSPGMI